MNNTKGKLYCVGVGPGDPELLTLKAVRVIENGDIIIAPLTEKKRESRALTIARQFIKENSLIVTQVFPMLTDKTTLKEAWQANKDQIAGYLDRGKNVVFLTLGDPMIYSTFIYLFKLFAGSGYTVETIPGIPSFCGIANQVGLPLAEWDESIRIVPSTLDTTALKEALSSSDNLVLMKVYKNYREVINLLKESGHIGNAVMVSNSGMEDEKIFTDLESVNADSVNYLSTIIARRKQWK